jgi:hypothetical protein
MTPTGRVQTDYNSHDDRALTIRGKKSRPALRKQRSNQLNGL